MSTLTSQESHDTRVGASQPSADMALKRVIIVRGLPGSGKTSYIRHLLGVAGDGAGEGGVVCSPDLFFYQSGAYVFVKSQIGEAHAWCRVRFLQALAAGEASIYLDYPFVLRWQYEDYEWMARLAGYEVSIVELAHEAADLADFAARNCHGVPIEVIKGMAKKWRPDPRAVQVSQAAVAAALGVFSSEDRAT